MKFSVWLLFFSWSLAYDTNHVGSIYISKLGDDLVQISLRMYGNKLYISDNRSCFEYDVRGTMSLCKSTKFLGVSKSGRLRLSDYPITGFVLTAQNGSSFRRDLSYYGATDFQLCGDYSVRHRSNCRGALNVTITFRDRFH